MIRIKPLISFIYSAGHRDSVDTIDNAVVGLSPVCSIVS